MDAWRTWLELQAQRARADRLARELEAMRASRSWRITAPLRKWFASSQPQASRPALRAGDAMRAPSFSECARDPSIAARIPAALVAAWSRDATRTLFVDVTVLDLEDLGAGGARVTRRILAEWLFAPPAGWQVVPVRLADDGTYRHARRFLARWFALNDDALGSDAAIEPGAGDLFVGLDFLREFADTARLAWNALQRAGVRVVTVCYDALPAEKPSWFPPAVPAEFDNWLRLATHADAIACISHATCTSLERALHARDLRVPALRVFPLGGDGLSLAGGASAFPKVPGRKRVVMVGTIEPRKGHADALDAMEAVWRNGIDAELVIAGRRGWNVDALIARMQAHAEAGRRLHWIEGPDDATLATLYRDADLLLVASHGEGFGLPIVEAAHFGCPLLLRDLPVFRETARDAAAYFGEGGASLADTLQACLTTSKPPAPMAWPTWREAAVHLFDLCRADDTVAAASLVPETDR